MSDFFENKQIKVDHYNEVSILISEEKDLLEVYSRFLLEKPHEAKHTYRLCRVMNSLYDQKGAIASVTHDFGKLDFKPIELGFDENTKDFDVIFNDIDHVSKSMLLLNYLKWGIKLTDFEKDEVKKAISKHHKEITLGFSEFEIALQLADKIDRSLRGLEGDEFNSFDNVEADIRNYLMNSNDYVSLKPTIDPIVEKVIRKSIEIG